MLPFVIVRKNANKKVLSVLFPFIFDKSVKEVLNNPDMT